MKSSHLLFVGIALLLTGCVIFPDVDVERPEFRGIVTDEQGGPVEGAEVLLFEMFPSFGSEAKIIDITTTGKNGAFFFGKKTHIDWVHKYHLLARARCRARIEIRSSEFETKSIEVVNQGKHYTQDICKGVILEKNVQIKRNN